MSRTHYSSRKSFKEQAFKVARLAREQRKAERRSRRGLKKLNKSPKGRRSSPPFPT